MRFLLPVVLFISITGYSQSMERVYSYLDTLCAPGMHGRGAEFNGDGIAAAFLRDQLREIGLKPFTEEYYQHFLYNINTFPGKCELKVGNGKLCAGKDFIVNAFSGPGKGNGKIVHLDTAIFHSDEARRLFLSSDLSNKILVYDSKNMPHSEKMPEGVLKKIYTAECVIELVDKLTAGLSTFQITTPVFKVLRSSFSQDAKKGSYNLDADFKVNYESQNVIGFVEGKVNPDSFIVVSAHYDHLGRMGEDVYFPGANDNGSGVSMMLELARFYSDPANTPDYSIAFMAFGAEEAGIIGSRYYVDHPLFPLKKIKVLVNLDLLGTGEDGIMVVNATVFPDYFDLLVQVNNEKGYLKEIKKRGEAANSDHYFFTKQGVPSFFIYTLGGIAAYHDVYDIPSTLPLTEFKDVFSLLTDFVRAVEEVEDPVGK